LDGDLPYHISTTPSPLKQNKKRYKKAADWGVIAQVASERSVPIIGNGDVLALYEATDRAALGNNATHALMAGRGALIKPWVFQEYKEGREIALDAAARVGVYRQLVSYMKEHFRDDARGKRAAFYFLPWCVSFFCHGRPQGGHRCHFATAHISNTLPREQQPNNRKRHFAWFHRYRAFPAAAYAEASRERPLMSTRIDLADELVSFLGGGVGWLGKRDWLAKAKLSLSSHYQLI
jgi:tRNA-dihydrouridine synthase 3